MDCKSCRDENFYPFTYECVNSGHFVLKWVKLKDKKKRRTNQTSLKLSKYQLFKNTFFRIVVNVLNEAPFIM